MVTSHDDAFAVIDLLHLRRGRQAGERRLVVIAVQKYPRMKRKLKLLTEIGGIVNEDQPDDLNQLQAALPRHFASVALTPLSIHDGRLAQVLLVPDLVEGVVERLDAHHSPI